MSAIRWLGLTVSLIVFILVFNRFRHGKIRRLDFVIGVGFSLAVFVMSVEPNAVNVLRDILLLEQAQFSRLIAILIVSNLLLWILFFYMRFRSGERIAQFDLLVRQLGLTAFAETYPRIDRLPPVVVVIPAFNEALTIEGVLKEMPASVFERKVAAIVIDDGSEDGTLDQARKAGALAIRNPIRRGGGAALRLGFDIAEKCGAEIVVTMDADGQHLPQEMERLVGPILADEADFVVGSRLLGRRERDSRVRLIGIHVFNLVIRLLTPAKVTDCSNGYRAFRVAELKRLLLLQDQFHTSEFIIDASRKGVRIGEAPVTVRRRLSGESKKGKNWSYGLWFARTVLKTWWR